MKKIQLAICLLLAGAIFNAEAKQITVNVLSISFSPKTFSAVVGDTIRFVWGAGFHTTTSTSVPTGAVAWNAPIDGAHTVFLYPLKVAGNYAYQCNFHVSMGMTGTFTVTPIKASIVATKAVSVNNCTNTNSLQYKCTLSKPPYKVQLFRYGLAFGTVRTVPDNLPFTYSNLPIGSYFAHAKGNNGADALIGKSGTNVLMPVPTSLRELRITGTKVTLKWSKYLCVKYYTVQYRVKGVLTWTKINTIGNKDSINLSGLKVNTKYQYSVAAVDSLRRIIATGRFSVIDSFMTKASGITALPGDNASSNVILANPGDLQGPAIVFPNPASSQFRIQVKDNNYISAVLRNVLGQVVWSEANSALLSKGRVVDVNLGQVPVGTYFLQLVDANKKSVIKKIIVTR